MTENRNNVSCYDRDTRGTVCIDTHRVLDSCRDRDCFENTRVYLSPIGEQILAGATNVRARSTSVLYAYVGVDEVPFNCGFYQVTVRYYVVIELEACLGAGRSQIFKGISVLEKQVILYGGEGNVTTFSSNPENDYCTPNFNNKGTTAPVAIVETVEPLVLGTKIVECGCPCSQNEYLELPECVRGCLEGDVRITTDAPRLYVSYGIFSVIRIVRPAQLLVNATDYSVPDKECVAATNDDDPCSVFRDMAFPSARFRGAVTTNRDVPRGGGKGNCCSK